MEIEMFNEEEFYDCPLTRLQNRIIELEGLVEKQQKDIIFLETSNKYTNTRLNQYINSVKKHKLENIELHKRIGDLIVYKQQKERTINTLTKTNMEKDCIIAKLTTTKNKNNTFK